MPKRTPSNDELIIRIDERVSEILRRLDAADILNAGLDKRITSLENFRIYLMGGAAVISIGFGLFWDYIKSRF